MSDKLDRFTHNARHALTLAQEAALRLNHNYIGPEHLLLGIAREENCMAVKVLRELGLEPRKIIHALERTAGHGTNLLQSKPRLAEDTKRIIELSVDEARLMEHHYIGTEHLLLGLVRQRESLAVNALSALGISLENVRIQTTRLHLQRQAQERQDIAESEAGQEDDIE